MHKLIRPQPLKIICEEIVFPVKNPYIQIYKYIRKIKIKWSKRNAQSVISRSTTHKKNKYNQQTCKTKYLTHCN